VCPSPEALDIAAVNVAWPNEDAYDVNPSSPVIEVWISPSVALTLGITKTDAIKAKVANITPKVLTFCSIVFTFFASYKTYTIGAG
jgi:hypothetical protein